MKLGKKRGNEKAYHMDGRDGVIAANGEANGVQDKPAGRKRFRFGKRSV